MVPIHMLVWLLGEMVGLESMAGRPGRGVNRHVEGLVDMAEWLIGMLKG